MCFLEGLCIRREAVYRFIENKTYILFKKLLIPICIQKYNFLLFRNKNYMQCIFIYC